VFGCDQFRDDADGNLLWRDRADVQADWRMNPPQGLVGYAVTKQFVENLLKPRNELTLPPLL